MSQAPGASDWRVRLAAGVEAETCDKLSRKEQIPSGQRLPGGREQSHQKSHPHPGPPWATKRNITTGTQLEHGTDGSGIFTSLASPEKPKTTLPSFWGIRL